ncbi:Proteasome activator complex subunit 3 [Nymphon striatum]|nr:Proteasome activator complex subunit 3 [Nymphon striatum]
MVLITASISSCNSIVAPLMTLSVADFKTELKKDAENLVIKEFPEKILEMNKILKSDKMNCKDLSYLHADLNIPVPEPISLSNCSDESNTNVKKRKLEAFEDGIPGTKVMGLPNGVVKSNKLILELIDMIKPKLRTLADDSNVLKMWIQFLMPKIEDGNNFGVSIQEDALGEIRAVESEALAFYDGITRYYTSRAKIISKVAKYPHVEDYRKSVNELDEKEYITVRVTLCEIRNHYSTLHDMLTKNLEKIKKPRSSNNETMY